MATPTTLPASFTAGQVLTAAQMNDLRGAFRILQIVSTTKSDTFTATSTSFVDITNLSLSITPTATSSKVLIMVSMNTFNDPSSNKVAYRLMRDSTAIAIGDTAGSRTRATVSNFTSDASSNGSASILFLDTPNTTSATTYKVQIAGSSANTVGINRTLNDNDNASFFRTVSTITAFEVSA